MTIEEIQLKLYENLKSSGWADKLKTFLLSNEFKAILVELYSQSSQGNRFTPVLKDVFKAFQECPYPELKVVIIGQDPYPQLGIADGIAFSCSYSKKEQPSLRYIFDEIERTVYNQSDIRNENCLPRESYDTDLKRWSNQGVLLLNTALTCEINKIGSHIDLWKPFIIYLLDMLNNYNSGIIYVFLGNKAKEWHKHISINNYKCFCSHPASAAYAAKKAWDSGNVFNQINKILIGLYGEKILW